MILAISPMGHVSHTDTPSGLSGSVKLQNNASWSSLVRTGIVTPYGLMKNHKAEPPANLKQLAQVPPYLTFPGIGELSLAVMEFSPTGPRGSYFWSLSV